MLKVNLTRVAIVPVAFALVFAISAPASAKKKAHPTYEQAWGICTKELDRNHILRAGRRPAPSRGRSLHAQIWISPLSDGQRFANRPRSMAPEG